LVIWGKEDKLIPLAHGQYYAEHLPNSKLEVLSPCGHMLPFERPEEFAELVCSFCK
jgi:pimeloyl-ACP methyl ester carboxylesterase